ncbi:MAG: branched-chain amino acid ABC transporter permease [Halorientalis sp.]
MAITDAIVNGMIQGSVYALFAASFTIIFGVMDIPNMAHAALFAGGGYVYYHLADVMELPWFVGIVGGTIAIVVLGAVIEKSLLKPLYGRSESEYIFGVILITLGVARILEEAYGSIWSRAPLSITISELQGAGRTVEVFNIPVTYLNVVVVAVAVANFVFLYWLINYTSIGRSIRAVVQDRELAYMKGIDVDRLFLFAFMLGSGMIAVAGILNAALYTLEPSMGFSLLIKAFIIVILGGFGNILGAAVAGFGLGLYEAVAVQQLSSYYIFASEFFLLIVFFLVKALVSTERSSPVITQLRARVANWRTSNE